MVPGACSPSFRWLARMFLPVLLAVGSGCVGDGQEEGAADTDPDRWEGDVAAATRALRPQEGSERDWEIFRTKVTMAWEEGLDTIPFGEALTRIGLSFVGTPYAPGTLEVAGEEDVVVNFEEFDCVTLVENVLALARFVRSQDPSILASELQTREAYRGTLREIRYRSGRVNGYPSRLHYFSDWIADNQAKGLVNELTQEMGGLEDPRAIDFMSTHPDAYRQLANGANFMEIQETETQLSGLTRFRIPETKIAGRESGIRDGDIIAATSTVVGLDVAHTGLAYWVGSSLHLLHAPLVGDSVEVSQLPVAERILRLEGQDGIRVVRPTDPKGGEGQGLRP